MSELVRWIPTQFSYRADGGVPFGTGFVSLYGGTPDMMHRSVCDGGDPAELSFVPDELAVWV